MKQIITPLIIILLTLGVSSCKNDDWSFPDFDYTTTYFPYQYPVRTLVLGDYNFDNSRDNEGKFLISATMGGVYENNEDITVNFIVDETLTENLHNNAGGYPLLPLPASYYTLSNNSTIVIPRGELSGGVEVQLTEAFFADPLAIGTNYVIPLKITGASTDSILVGKSEMAAPDPRIPANWALAPKDFTLFAVRFVNEYSGRYLLRGQSVVRNDLDEVVETIIYRRREIVYDEVVPLITSALDKVTYESSIRLSEGSPGGFEIEVTFNSQGNATIVNTDKYPHTITGNAQFLKDGDEWGDKLRNVVVMNYTIDDGTLTHEVNDTLVFRDKAVSFQQFVPLIINP